MRLIDPAAARVLVLDTTGPVVGVALVDHGVVTQRTARVTRGAEERLVPWAQELCAEAGFALAALDGIGVARGPGAFTGLRVGLATAVGLAMAVDRPLWGGSSLASRAARARATASGASVMALLDARKGRVYALATGADGAILAGPGDVPPAEAVAWMAPGFVATGEGAVVYREVIEAAGGRLAPEADDPAVDVLATQAAEAVAAGEAARAVDVAPVYLRPPDAKRSVRGRIDEQR